MLNGIKQTLVKLVNFINGEGVVTEVNKSNNEYYDREVLLIGKNQSNLKDLKSIISQLNHNCKCAETIEQAEIYFESARLRLIVLDFDKSICSISFPDLELFCKIPIFVFVN